MLLANDLTSSFACSLVCILDTAGFATTTTAGTGVGVGGTETVESGVATRGTCVAAVLRGGVYCDGAGTAGILLCGLAIGSSRIGDGCAWGKLKPGGTDGVEVREGIGKSWRNGLVLTSETLSATRASTDKETSSSMDR